MTYHEMYNQLRQALRSEEPKVVVDNIELYRFPFHSTSQGFLPGKDRYNCKEHNLVIDYDISYTNDIKVAENVVQIRDVEIKENKHFSYYLMKPVGEEPLRKITFLFHGLNEKNWEKYLTWGKAICDSTGSGVLFFPLAFHMDRAPLQWGERHSMADLCNKRKKLFPNIVNSTLMNVAISMRLHSMPQRIIWSGLQTYNDVLQLTEFCKKGKHELIHKDFSANFFAYSIGGMLAQILKMANYKGYFTESKVCLFCSGTVLNRASPSSKFILDSEANVAIYSYLAEHFDTFLRKDPVLSHYIEDGHFEGKVFRSMLEYQKLRDFREEQFRKVENDFYAVALRKDFVIPFFEVINTLQGAMRDINIKVDEFDFPYNYSHENPFPINAADPALVNQHFNEVFGRVGDFLKD